MRPRRRRGPKGVPQPWDSSKGPGRARAARGGGSGGAGGGAGGGAELGGADVLGGHVDAEGALAFVADEVEGLGPADGPSDGLAVPAALAGDDGSHDLGPSPTRSGMAWMEKACSRASWAARPGTPSCRLRDRVVDAATRLLQVSPGQLTSAPGVAWISSRTWTRSQMRVRTVTAPATSRVPRPAATRSTPKASAGPPASSSGRATAAVITGNILPNMRPRVASVGRSCSPDKGGR